MATDGTDSLTLDRRRWTALSVLCLCVLLIVFAGTVANVALVSIGKDLHFHGSSLVWVMNAYSLTLGGFLMLSGRLGDLFGERRLLLIGIALFSAASFACGLAHSQLLFVIGRACQGLGGAIALTVPLALIVRLFPAPAERAKALSLYGFVLGGGASISLLVGGTIATFLSWHWVFFVNVPMGAAIFVICWKLLPDLHNATERRRVDVWGAITLTTALLLTIYAIVNSNKAGQSLGMTLAILLTAAGVFALFLSIELRVSAPLIPLAVFRNRDLVIVNVVRVLWSASLASLLYFATLYMQLVLGYTPMQVGLAFLPTNIIMSLFLLGLSARLVSRFGVKRLLGIGLFMGAAAMALLARAQVNGSFVDDVLPGMVLFGLAIGIAFSPMMLASMNGIPPHQTGLASGILNTAAILGSALGLSVLVALASGRTEALEAAGAPADIALAGGYRFAFWGAAACAMTAALLAAAGLRITPAVRVEYRSSSL
jgi:EmrB/QacA subfamily drug resistance transporter